MKDPYSRSAGHRLTTAADTYTSIAGAKADVRFGKFQKSCTTLQAAIVDLKASDSDTVSGG